MIFTPGKQRKIIHCNLMQAALGAVQNPRCAVVIHNVICVLYFYYKNVFRILSFTIPQNGYLYN